MAPAMKSIALREFCPVNSNYILVEQAQNETMIISHQAYLKFSLSAILEDYFLFPTFTSTRTLSLRVFSSSCAKPLFTDFYYPSPLSPTSPPPLQNFVKIRVDL